MKLRSWILVVIAVIAIAIVTAPRAAARLQRPDGQLVSGATSGGAVYPVLVDSDGTLHVTASGSTSDVNVTKIGGTSVSANNGTADAGTLRVAVASDNTAFKIRNTPAMTGYVTQASFNTSGIWLVQNTTTNQATATTTLLQSVLVTNQCAAAVAGQIMDGNSRYALGPTFSIPANSQYVLNVPTGVIMTSGINVSANTANCWNVAFGGLQ